MTCALSPGSCKWGSYRPLQPISYHRSAAQVPPSIDFPNRRQSRVCQHFFSCHTHDMAPFGSGLTKGGTGPRLGSFARIQLKRKVGSNKRCISVEKLRKLCTFMPLLATFSIAAIASLTTIQIPAITAGSGPLPLKFELLQILVDWKVTLILAFSFMAFSSGCADKFYFSTQAAYSSMLNKMMDTFFASCFRNVGEQEKYQFRMTIFIGSGGWVRQRRLKPYLRRGHVPVGKSKTFLLLGETEKDCEGIAGQAWAINSFCSAKLPEWDDSDVGKQTAYAKASCLPLEKAQALSIKSRSIFAHIIRRKGKQWGVLVLDARPVDGLKSEHEEAAKLHALIIAAVLDAQES